MGEHLVGDPLEAGVGLGVVHAGGCRHLRQQRRGDEGRDHHPVVTFGRGEEVIGEQPADLVAAEAPPTAAVQRDRRPETVGVGVVGERQHRARAGCRRQQQIHRPRFLRVGEGHRGKVRIGLLLLVDDGRRAPTRRARTPAGASRRRRRASRCRPPARAPGQAAGERRGRPRGRRRGARRRGGRSADRRDRTARRSSGRRRRSRAEMSTSAGGTIWAPVPRYTLYPLSAGGLWLAVTITPAAAPSSVTFQASTGVGIGRGSSSARTPAAAATARRVERERVALVPRVVPDHDAGGRRVRHLADQVGDEPGGRLADHEAVHPLRPGAERGRAARRCRTADDRRNGRRARPGRRRAAPRARRGCRRRVRPPTRRVRSCRDPRSSVCSLPQGALGDERSAGSNAGTRGMLSETA